VLSCPDAPRSIRGGGRDETALLWQAAVLVLGYEVLNILYEFQGCVLNLFCERIQITEIRIVNQDMLQYGINAFRSGYNAVFIPIALLE
jgi:hypothetical protein